MGAFIRENTLYISLLYYTGITATSRWIQFQLPILLFFDRHPQLVCEHVKGLNYMCHTKRTCLARPVVCWNQTLTTFENAMFLSYLRMARWFSPKCSIFSTIYQMAQAQNEWNGIAVPIWKTVFITCLCYLYKLTPTLFFKLVDLVLVMRPLTDNVYFVGIVSKNWPNLLQHAMPSGK